MGFGQYSTHGKDRMSKADMLADVERQDPDAFPLQHARMFARNTLRYVTRHGEERTRLHGTDVVREFPDGTAIIETGGWNTATTRDRINRALEGTAFVFTRQGTLYLAKGGEDRPFVRRVTINPDETVSTDLDQGEAVSYEYMKPYVERYLDRLRRHGVPVDTAGDPWIPTRPDGLYDAQYVRLWLTEPEAVRAHGEDPEDPDEQEPYVFGTLVANALEWSGLRSESVALFVRQHNHAVEQGQRPDSFHVISKVRRYLRACLGYASS